MRWLLKLQSMLQPAMTHAMKDTVTAKLAYSQTSDKGALHGANTATSTGASKLYTEAWWNYGKVTMVDTAAYNLTVETPASLTFVDLGLYATMTDQDDKNGKNDITEVTLTASKSFGPLDTTVAYIFADPEEGDSVNTIQAYLTLNF